MRRIRLGLPKGYLTVDLHPEVESAFERTKRLLSDNGIKLIEVDMKALEMLSKKLSMIISTYEGPISFQKYLAEYKISLSYEQLIEAIETPEMKVKFQKFLTPGALKAVKKEKYDECMNVWRPQLLAEYRQLFEKNELNALIYPSLVCPPIRFDELKGAETMWLIGKNCIMTSNVCMPSLTMPMGVSKAGMPIGVQLEALWNQDRILLKIASKISEIINK